MSPDLAASPQRSRTTIMAELATVLRDSDANFTNLESVIARTSVSPLEIANFGGKRELLLAMVSQLSDAMSAPLAVGPTKSDWRQRLLEFGRCVTDIYVNSHLRGLYRIAITESIRHTGLGRDFYEVGPGRLTQHLADFLQTAQAEGALRCGDPHLLASNLLSVLRANLDSGDTFPHDMTTRPVSGGEYVQNAVDLFCRGINGGGQRC